MLQGPAVDVKSSSPSPGVSNDGSDVTSSPAQQQANLHKTSNVGVSGTDGRTDERSGADQLPRSSSLPTNVPVCICYLWSFSVNLLLQFLFQCQ